MKILSLEEIVGVDDGLMSEEIYELCEGIGRSTDPNPFTNHNASFIEIRLLIIDSFFNQDLFKND